MIPDKVKEAGYSKSRTVVSLPSHRANASYHFFFLEHGKVVVYIVELDCANASYHLFFLGPFAVNVKSNPVVSANASYHFFFLGQRGERN